MEISPEDIEKFRLTLKQDQEESIRLHEKEIYYKKLIEEDNFDIELAWIEKFDDLDMKYLGSFLDKEFFNDFNRNFSIVRLNLYSVLIAHCGSEEEANKIYPKDELWAEHIGRSNRNIVRIIEYVESGQLLCPPIIDISSD